MESRAIEEPSHHIHLDKDKKHALNSSRADSHHKKHKGPKTIQGNSDNKTNSNASTTAEVLATANKGNDEMDSNTSTRVEASAIASEGEEMNSNVSIMAKVAATASKGGTV